MAGPGVRAAGDVGPNPIFRKEGQAAEEEEERPGAYLLRLLSPGMWRTEQVLAEGRAAQAVEVSAETQASPKLPHIPGAGRG